MTESYINALRKELVAECGQSGKMERAIDAVCDLALTAILSAARMERLEAVAKAQLYPLREIARIADLVWRDAHLIETPGGDHFYPVSPRLMEHLADALHKLDVHALDAEGWKP